MSNQLNDLISRGIVCLQRGDRTQAHQLLDMAVKLDDNNVQAWWWLTQTIEDDHVRIKYEKHTREIAAKVPGGREVYTELFKQSGAALLTRNRLVSTSKSIGSECPVDTSDLVIDDIVIVCPVCKRASHVECWEENLFHCGHFACAGMGLIDHDRAIETESALKETSVTLNPEDIPDETPWENRETQETEFVDKLRQHAISQMTQDVLNHLRAEEEKAEFERKQAEQQKQELTKRVTWGFLAGLLAGLFLAYKVYQYSHSWFMAVLTVYLCASGISTAAKSAYQATDRLTSILYWLLPKGFSALIMVASFAKWHNGLTATLIAILGGLIVIEGLFHVKKIHQRRAFITYSVLGLAGLFLIQTIYTDLH